MQTSFKVSISKPLPGPVLLRLLISDHGQDPPFSSPIGPRSKLASVCWRPTSHTCPSDLLVRLRRLCHAPCAFPWTLYGMQRRRYRYNLHGTLMGVGTGDRPGTRPHKKARRVVKVYTQSWQVDTKRARKGQGRWSKVPHRLSRALSCGTWKQTDRYQLLQVHLDAPGILVLVHSAILLVRDFRGCVTPPLCNPLDHGTK